MTLIREIKTEERSKFKKIRCQSSFNERKNVQRNVELYIQSLDKSKWLNKYFAIYWPLKYEVDLRDLKKKFPLALPKCENDQKLNFYIWNDSPLKNDMKGIPSPINSYLLDHRRISHIFVPCLSVDKKLTRLGYGGGYYDKLRSNKEWKVIPCIGILTQKCVSKDLLRKANWDVPLTGYITNDEILI